LLWLPVAGWRARGHKPPNLCLLGPPFCFPTPLNRPIVITRCKREWQNGRTSHSLAKEQSNRGTVVSRKNLFFSLCVLPFPLSPNSLLTDEDFAPFVGIVWVGARERPLVSVGCVGWLIDWFSADLTNVDVVLLMRVHSLACFCWLAFCVCRATERQPTAE